MIHKQKIKVANQLATKADKKAHIPVFQTVGWYRRKFAIEARVKRQEEKSKKRAQSRKERAQLAQKTV